MPRRSNTSNTDARQRRYIRINVIAGNQQLRNTIRNKANIIHSATTSRVEKERAKNAIMNMAIRTFTIQRQLNALPLTRSKIVEKMINAWPHAVQRAMNMPRRPRRQAEIQPRVNRSPARASLPPFRNAALARGPNGKPVVVYFPNN
jgi:hypothetical protein